LSDARWKRRFRGSVGLHRLSSGNQLPQYHEASGSSLGMYRQGRSFCIQHFCAPKDYAKNVQIQRQTIL
jgi:hypothetical protein